MATAQSVISPHLQTTQGLRQVHIWVPDMRTSDFRNEAHRQSQAVAASFGEGDDQAFIDAISMLDGGQNHHHLENQAGETDWSIG